MLQLWYSRAHEGEGPFVLDTHEVPQCINICLPQFLRLWWLYRGLRKLNTVAAHSDTTPGQASGWGQGIPPGQA